MPSRLYSVAHNRSERWFPDQTKAFAEARAIGSAEVWCYEPLSIPAKEMQVLMLNGSRWWFERSRLLRTDEQGDDITGADAI